MTQPDAEERDGTEAHGGPLADDGGELKMKMAGATADDAVGRTPEIEEEDAEPIGHAQEQAQARDPELSVPTPLSSEGFCSRAESLAATHTHNVHAAWGLMLTPPVGYGPPTLPMYAPRARRVGEC